MKPLEEIALVMFGAGVVGGFMNMFISNKEDSTRLPWWQHVILGIGASFMVPLFLNMISSDLIKDVIGADPSKPGDSSKLLVLAGFSLVAAVSSRAFIRSLSDKVLQEVKEAKAEAKAAKTQAMTALNVVDEKDRPEGAPSLMSFRAEDGFSESERKVMAELTSGGFSMRSLAGLSKGTGLDKELVNVAISSLMSKGLVEQGLNAMGQIRWYLSPSGRDEAGK